MALAESSVDPLRQEKAQEYGRLSRRLSLIELAIVGVLLLSILFGGASIELGKFLTVSQPWAAAVYLVILAVGCGVVTAPLNYYQGFVLPHRYGLLTQKFRSWLGDKAKAAGLSMLMALAAVAVIYWLMERLPGMWWLLAGIFLLLLSLLLTRLMPTLLLSLFFKVEPLEDVGLKQRLVNLAERAKTQIRGVFTIDLSSKGTTANAMLAGWGKTRRIILGDTLIEQYSPEELEVVLAHELAHHVNRDIPKLITVQAAILLLGFYLADLTLKFSLVPLSLQGIGDVAALPLLLLVLGGFGLIMTPLTNAYNRHVELRADGVALWLTDNPEAFVRVMTKLTDQNLTEAQPSRWVELLFYDHPPYTKRVSLAYNYQKEAH